MASDPSTSLRPPGRVLRFRRRPYDASPSAPVADLAKYERGQDDADDYRHRMIVNALAFLFVLALIGAGLWLAETIVQLRLDQDCVLSGRRGCTPVEIGTHRW